MSVCLVTGGAGFIGSHLVDALIARGDVVRVLDNFQTGSLDNLTLSRKAEVYFDDLTNLDTLRQVMQGVDYVFHNAVPPVWDHDRIHSDASPHSCLSGTISLLQAAHDARVRRLIYASSCEVYGQATDLPISESGPVQPISRLGKTKLAEERACIAFTRQHGLETVVLRYFNVFGPRQPSTSPYAALIPQILKAMLLGRSPAIHGDGLDPQDFIYVGDAVHATILASEVPRVAGKVFNLARGFPTTPLELVDTLNAIIGSQCRPIHVPARPVGELHHLADVSLAEIELGFCTSTDLEQGLRHCVNGYGSWRNDMLAVVRGG